MRRAFSLVEVMIAIALGMIILATVYAGFRVATQSVIACNRLSIQNRLLTAGMARALDEIDFWNKFDRPGWQPARTSPTQKIFDAPTPIGDEKDGNFTGFYDRAGADSGKIPQPFTPFALSWKEEWNDVPDAQNQNKYDHRWLPHLPWTWYRGDGRLYLTEKSKTDKCQYGNYAIFSCSKTKVKHLETMVDVGMLPSNLATWYASQQKGLSYGLGFYGWWEYLPANAVIDWYDHDKDNIGVRAFAIARREAGQGSNPIGTTNWSPVDNVGRFTLNTGMRGNMFPSPWASFNERPVTRSAFLWEHVIGICAPRPAIGTQPADNVNEALRLNRWMGGMRKDGSEDEYQSPFNLLSKELTRDEPLVVSRPKGWPQVTWDVRRYKMFSRTVNDCFVRIFDPLTATMVEINFRAIGTTLRGARLQRNLD